MQKVSGWRWRRHRGHPGRHSPIATGVLALTLALAPAGKAGAQSAQMFSVQISGLFAGLQGSAYNNLGPGFGAEAQLRVTPSALSVGAGMQLTRHDFALQATTFQVSVYGPFLEPRYVIATRLREFAPYVSARFSLLRQHYEVGGFEGSSVGTTINGGGGGLVRLGSRVNLDIGATYGFTSFRRFTITDNETGERTTLPAGEGSNIVFRVGLAFGLRG